MPSLEDDKKRWREEWDQEHALVDAVILAFDLNLVYDYPIPPACDVETLLKAYLEKKGVSKAFKEELWGIIRCSRDEYSRLERYLGGSDNVFGHEWFCGFGTLSRWRPGEREKAMERVDKYLTPLQKKWLSKLHNAIKIQTKPEPFAPMKAKVAAV